MYYQIIETGEIVWVGKSDLDCELVNCAQSFIIDWLIVHPIDIDIYTRGSKLDWDRLVDEANYWKTDGHTIPLISIYVLSNNRNWPHSVA